MPVTSLSPRSFTKTRSLRDSLIRSKGSWIPVAEGSMEDSLSVELKEQNMSHAILNPDGHLSVDVVDAEQKF